MRRKNAWTTYNKKQLDELEKLCKNYLKFLDKGKTERECVKQIVKQAEEKGYVNLADITKDKKALKAGDKVYSVCMDKTVALFQIGKKKLEKGMNILGAHIDSPRMDVKQNPLYESEEFAYLDTHYYGGIKKYQWVTLPLALHGVVVKKQMATHVRVIVGNPPYSIGQKSANDNAQNLSYPYLDKRVSETYAVKSSATLNKSLYDSYVKAFRWASDRIPQNEGGIVAFISNGAWIDGAGQDGMRRCFEDEFTSVHPINA